MRGETMPHPNLIIAKFDMNASAAMEIYVLRIP